MSTREHHLAIRRLSPALALAIMLVPATLAAQGGAPPPARRDTVANPRVVPTPAALAVADTLLREMDLERVMQSGAISTFDATIDAQPMMAQFRDVIVAWATKHLTWAEFGAPMRQLYSEMFTERELRAFLAFYRTAEGRQLARLTPELSRRGAQMGAEIASKHTAELQEMMKARIEELQRAGSPPPAGTPPPAR